MDSSLFVLKYVDVIYFINIEYIKYVYSFINRTIDSD